MSKVIYLFCEGKPGGIDMQLLKKIPFSRLVTIQPFGGKGGHSRYMDGYGAYLLSLGTTQEKAIVGFRDRDFDFPYSGDQQPHLTKAGNNVYAGNRITIENYLLDPMSLFTFLTSAENTKKYGKLFSSVAEVKKEIFDRAANDLIFLQAARHALGEIRNKNAVQTTNFYGIKSGKLPFSLTESSCRLKAYKVINDYKFQSKLYCKARFIKAYQKYIHIFQQKKFTDNSEYLFVFHGKDMETAIQKYLPTGFPFKLYYRDSVDNFNYLKPGFEDLVELKTIIDKI